jgi:hypothetical protein
MAAAAGCAAVADRATAAASVRAAQAAMRNRARAAVDRQRGGSRLVYQGTSSRHWVDWPDSVLETWPAIAGDMPVSSSMIAAMPMNRDVPLRALAQDPSGASVGLTQRALPPGHIVDVTGAGPLYWVSDDAPTVEDMAWARAGSAVSGLWPLLVDGGGAMTVVELAADGPQERIRYWLGEGQPSDPSEIDPERRLADQWTDLTADNEANDYYEEHERVSALAPAGTAWPGLAPQVAWDGSADDYANGMTEHLLANSWLEQPRMVLVPAVSSSDALVAGLCTLAEINDIAGHAAVLRSWEQRLGARAIALRHDTLFVSVAATPADRVQAAHIACEHFVFAPDNVLQNSDSFPDYVDTLVGTNVWGFWWD